MWVFQGGANIGQGACRRWEPEVLALVPRRTELAAVANEARGNGRLLSKGCSAACTGSPPSVGQVSLLNLAEQRAACRRSVSAHVLGHSDYRLITVTRFDLGEKKESLPDLGLDGGADAMANLSDAQTPLFTLLFSKEQREDQLLCAHQGFHDDSAPMPTKYLTPALCFATVAPDDERRCLLEGRMW